MAFRITLAGESGSVAGTENFTEEEARQWLQDNQVFYTSESLDKPSTGDTSKYIFFVYSSSEE